MTTMDCPLVGAFPTCLEWELISWRSIEKQVRRLQMRIAKAIWEGKPSKAKALQWLLTHAFHAKLLAVKRVAQNQGGKTAGVDGVVWKTPQQKMDAAKSLQRRGYRPQPLRRIYIPKKNGKQRPLGIPTMVDRAQQALHLLGLEPKSETLADKNAYGFRPKRSTADAIEQCFIALARKTSAQWIFEGDIKSCFDTISHEWLRANIGMDTKVLSKWLAAGYVDKQVFYPTTEGTPQGGIISPTLMTMTLRGLEEVAKHAALARDKIHVITYADDFIITGASREVLERKIKPAVEAFLRERGLKLSQEKTQITHIEHGFDFLGFNVRKYNGKLLIKPSKKNVFSFLAKIRDIIRSNRTVAAVELIRKLNSKIRGWTNYYRHVVSKKTFAYIENQIFHAIWRWARRRHPNKGATWVKKKYFRTQGLRQWIFSAKTQHKQGQLIYIDLHSPAYVAIRRHVKIKAEANPFNPAFTDYFHRRKRFLKQSNHNVNLDGGFLPVF